MTSNTQEPIHEDRVWSDGHWTPKFRTSPARPGRFEAIDPRKINGMRASGAEKIEIAAVSRHSPFRFFY